MPSPGSLPLTDTRLIGILHCGCPERAAALSVRLRRGSTLGCEPEMKLDPSRPMRRGPGSTDTHSARDTGLYSSPFAAAVPKYDDPRTSRVTETGNASVAARQSDHPTYRTIAGAQITLRSRGGGDGSSWGTTPFVTDFAGAGPTENGCI